jgi:hypothetical protein
MRRRLSRCCPGFSDDRAILSRNRYGHLRGKVTFGLCARSLGNPQRRLTTRFDHFVGNPLQVLARPGIQR